MRESGRSRRRTRAIVALAVAVAAAGAAFVQACRRRETPAFVEVAAAETSASSSPVTSAAPALVFSATAPDPAANVRFTTRAAGNTATSQILEWTFEGPGVRAPRVVVLVPAWAEEGVRYPVLFALHGRGEAQKGPAQGAWGWPKDYALTRAVDRLASPPLAARDFENFVTPNDLAAKNKSLLAQPYGGLVVVCPYVPDLDLKNDRDAREYGRFLLDVVLPRVLAETPALDGPEALGIDGISLGGYTALVVGLANPERFGAVSGIQPALQPSQVVEWVDKARAARARNPHLALRLATSDDDFFRGVVTRTSQAWRAAGIRHDFHQGPGPHDYVYNRGPGAYELLLWNDRALRRGP
jgi:enterochelin esterase-like enzyme